MKPYQHTVQYYETDRMGVTHHSNYIRWMEEARIDFLDQLGWSYAKLEKLGVISPVTAVECKYKASTTFADVVRICVQVEEFKGVRLRLRYEMEKADGTPVCEGHSEHCFLGKDGRILRLKREYPDFCAALQKLAE